ncbi:hypothetical protein FAES_2281 [Fibrella aestuarina BUZ 2]|uniref:Uncharacterized protein n=1 Tax=Fibrella aestuarina BUZ 2 TaxID=1166018 RepID=I0K837_9BACT|nr:hypothetical protein [Fibrella aestuarina]CCH00290.1 hypothetical protein FAES_2281 [Fibrella aestuarina BUZ 2]
MAQPYQPSDVKAFFRRWLKPTPPAPPRSIKAEYLADGIDQMIDMLSVNTWAPVFGLVSDGLRLVIQIVDWTGGLGPKPNTGEYIGTTGRVANIADAVSIRGTQGIKGWSPLLQLQSTAPVGGTWVEGIVLKVVDWTGGEGNKPGLGYVGANGIVADASQAVNVRGASWFASDTVPLDLSDPAAFGQRGDLCLHTLTGDVYRCELGTGRWMLKGNLRGIPGLNWRGAWVANTVYAVGDVVATGGSAYVRKVAGSSGSSFSGVGANWDLLVAKGDKGDQGNRGWTQIAVLVSDGNRVVRQVTDYIGGEGPKPTDYIGQYITSTGFTTNIALAQDVRGPQGIQGLPGTLTASAFPEVNNGGGIADTTYAVLQQGTTLQRIPLNALPIRMNSLFGPTGNIAQDLRGLLFSQYTDIFQGRLLESCEKWNTGTSAWDVQNATVSLGFQKLLAGRPFLASQTIIYAGDKYRLTIQTDNSSEGAMLAIYMGYFTGAVGFGTNLKVTVETSSNGGTSYTTRLAETNITFSSYYLFMPVDLGGNRVRVTLDAVGAAGSNFALHGLGGFSGKSSNQGRFWNRLPFGWNYKQYASFGFQANDGPPDCAALEVRSTDAGFLFPRMSGVQRDAIPSQTDGLTLYVTDSGAPGGFWGRIAGFFHKFLTVTAAGVLNLDELQLPSAFRNRKLVMWQVTGNDHQFIGLGANSGEFRLQVDGSNTDYNWYAGTSPALSALLMRLTGLGKLLLGTNALTNSNAQAEIAGTNANDGVIATFTNKFSAAGRKGAQLQFHNTGISMWRIGLAAGDDQAGDAFVFKGWAGGSFPELVRITATGSIGIGTDNPQEKLHVMGRVRSAGIVAGGTTPGIVARPGLGTGAAAAISGADMAGLISLTAGSGTGANAEVCKVTFATAYTAAPKVVMLDARSKNGRYQLGRLFVSAITATDFTISTTDSAIDAGTANIDIQYVVIA